MKMEFTEEDRDRVFQEEKARHEAQERIKAEEKAKKATNARYGCGGCLGLIVLLGIIIALMPASKTTDPCHDLANMVDTIKGIIRLLKRRKYARARGPEWSFPRNVANSFSTMCTATRISTKAFMDALDKNCIPCVRRQNRRCYRSEASSTR